eukprot:m.76459 g.76459  ORF g.76459 m.76459 type:complete len:1499 (+) comp9063_c0_seq1:263-4759(+)
MASMLRGFGRVSTPDTDGENVAVLASLRQLKHDHDVLLKEKRNMELYCQEVEADMQTKEDSIQVLNREVLSARRMIEERERQLEEERTTSRQLKFEVEASTPERRKKGRVLPRLPGESVFEQTNDDGDDTAALSNEGEIKRLQNHVKKLEKALQESREKIRQRALVDGATAVDDETRATEPAEVVALRDELVVACQSLDNDTVLDLARRFHQKSAELTEAVRIEELLREENARLAEENVVLRDGYEAAETEREELEEKNQKLADNLDEALGYLDALREAEATTQASQALLSIEEEHRAEGEIKSLRAQLEAANKHVADLEESAKETEAQMHDLRQQVLDVASSNQATSLERSALESSLEEERAAHASLSRELEAMRSELAESTRQCTTLDGALKEAERRADAVTTDMARLRRELEAATEREAELQSRVAAAEAAARDAANSDSDAVAQARAEAIAAAEHAASVEASHAQHLADATAAHEAAIEQVREQLAQAAAAQVDSEAAAAAAKALAEANARERATAHEIAAELRGEHSDLQRDLADVQSKLDKLTSQHKVVSESHKVAIARVEALEKDLLAANQRHEAANARADAAEDKVTSLESRLAAANEAAQEAAAREAKAVETAHKQRTAEVAQLAADVESAAAQLDVLAEDRDRLKARLTEATTTVETLRAERKADASGKTEEVASLAEQCRDATRRLEDKTRQFNEAEAKVAKLTADAARQSSRADMAEHRVEQLKESLLGAEQQREMTLASLRSSQDEAGDAIAAEVKRLKELVDRNRDGVHTIEIHANRVVGSDGHQGTDDAAGTGDSLGASVAAVKDGLHEVSMSACKLDAMMLKLFDAHRAEVSGLTNKAANLDKEHALLLADKASDDEARQSLEADLAAKTEELKVLMEEFAMSTTRCGSVSAERDQLRAQLATAKQDLLDAQEEVEYAHREVDEAKRSATQMEESVEAVGRDLGRKLTALANAEAQCAQLEAERDQLAATNADLKREVTDLTELQSLAGTVASKMADVHAALAAEQEDGLEKAQEISRLKEATAMLEVSLEKEREEVQRVRKAADDEKDGLLKEMESLRTKIDDLQARLTAQASDLAAARNDVTTAQGERDAALANVQAAEAQCRSMDARANDVGSKVSVATNEVARLQRRVAVAAESMRRHTETEGALRTELMEKDRQREALADQVAALQHQMDQRETQHKKVVARVLERADTEIRKYKAQAVALQQAIEDAARKLAEKPDLSRQFETVNYLAVVLEGALGMKKSVPVAVRAADATALQIDAVCARMEYAQQLVKLLASKKQAPGSAAVVRAHSRAAAAAVGSNSPAASPSTLSASAGPVTARPSSHAPASALASEPPADLGAEHTAVDRLLSAVKKFYVAKNGADALSSAEPPVTESFSPHEHQDESSIDPSALQPQRPLTDQEQEKLFQDWCRLKSKVRGVVKQLVAAKAAVAFLRYQDEQTKVYARNRDRLLSQLIGKIGAKKKAKMDLLKILNETCV